MFFFLLQYVLLLLTEFIYSNLRSAVVSVCTDVYEQVVTYSFKIYSSSVVFLHQQPVTWAPSTLFATISHSLKNRTPFIVPVQSPWWVKVVLTEASTVYFLTQKI